MKTLRTYSLLLLLCVVAFTKAYSQDGLKGEEVEITKAFEAIIANTDRINAAPQIDEADNQKLPVDYRLPSMIFPVSYDPPKIRPLRMKKLPTPKPKKFYFKGGFGLPFQPYGEIAWNNGESEKADFGIRLKHHSINNNAAFELQRESNSLGEINGAYYTDKFAIEGLAAVNLDQYGKFGYDHDLVSSDSIDTKEDVLNYTTIHVGAGIYNPKKINDVLKYKASIDFYNLNSPWENNETEFLVGGGISYWVSDKYPIRIDGGLHTNVLEIPGESTTNSVAHISPSFTYAGNAFRIKLGGAFYTDTTLIPYPDIEATVNVVGSQVVLFGGWSGKVRKNTLRTLTKVNPYLGEQVSPIYNTRIQDRYLGVRGDLGRTSYEFRVGSQPSTNEVLYVNDSTQFRNFNLIYDKLNTVAISGNAVIKVIPNLTIDADIDYKIYNPDVQEKAWHLPAVDLDIGAVYKLSDQLRVSSDWFMKAGASYRQLDGTAANLPVYFDVNFGAQYEFMKNAGFFIDLNNIISGQNEAWKYHPNVGFNFLVGVEAKF